MQHLVRVYIVYHSSGSLEGHMPAAAVKIGKLVNYRSRCVHCPQVVTDKFTTKLNRSMLCRAHHAAQPGRQRSDYRIKYITTCIYYKALSRSPRSRSTLPAKARLSKQNRPMSCHAQLAAQSGSALFRI